MPIFMFQKDGDFAVLTVTEVCLPFPVAGCHY